MAMGTPNLSRCVMTSLCTWNATTKTNMFQRSSPTFAP
jgi:hypothetical protein